MSLHQIPITDLVIPNSGTASNVLLASNEFRDSDAITIYGPNGLIEATRVQVSYTETNPVWFDLQRSGADVTIVADEAETVELISFLALRLASALTGAERTFKVTKAVWV